MDRPPLPSDIDLTEDRRANIVATSVTTWVLAIIAIVLRVESRRAKGAKLWLDDWLILASMLPSSAHVFGMAAYAVSRGLGQHIWVTPPDSVYAWALGLFIAELGYFLTLIFVKLSILAFYWRTFQIERSIRMPIWILATTVFLWGFAVILVTLFQCQPIHSFWSRFDPDHPLLPSSYHCGIEDEKFFYANAIPTIATDIFLLILPVPYVWKLHLPRTQKFAIAGLFLVGVFVTFVSAVRFQYLLKVDLDDPDLTWSFVDVGLWSVVEGNIGMVCACLPFLRPTLNRLTGGSIFTFPTLAPKLRKSSNGINMDYSRDNAGRWEEIGHGMYSTRVEATITDNASDERLFMSGRPRLLEQDPGSTRDGQVASKAGERVSTRHHTNQAGIRVTTDIHLHRQSAAMKGTRAEGDATAT